LAAIVPAGLLLALAIIVTSSASSSRRVGGDRAVVVVGGGNSSDGMTSTSTMEEPPGQISSSMPMTSSSSSEEEEEEERDAVIEYVEVPSGEGGVMRYAANMRRGSATAAISIRYWMTLVASSSSSHDSSSSSIGTKASRDLSKIIASSPYSSLLFEMPGTTWDTSDASQFEFALVDMPALDAFVNRSGPDRDAFGEHFESSSSSSSCGRMTSVCAFPNLGGDATLVSPVPLGDASNDVTYSHLARFVGGAPEGQILEFWNVASSTYLDVLRRKDTEDEGRDDGVSGTWLSTNGMGVAWLHLRIDDRPKYYSYAPFKTLR
jgi:hypothetical protein